MWTEEKLNELAREYSREVYECTGQANPYVEEAFLAGARFIINNTQKE